MQPLDGPHRRTYDRLRDSRDKTKAAHYALEEGEYRSALEYIAEAEKALTEARKMIEPEMRPTIHTYQWWVKRFYNFTGKKPAAQWRGPDVTLFLRQLHEERYFTRSGWAMISRRFRSCFGHANIETTQVYLHGDAARGVSPLDCRQEPLASPKLRSSARTYLLR